MAFLRLLPLCLIALLVSCGPVDEAEESESYDSGVDQLIAEYGDTKVSRKSVERVLELSKQLTLDWRSKGILEVVKQVKAKLAAQGETCKALDQIEDFTIGQALPGLDGWELGPKDSSGVTSLTKAIKKDNPNSKYEACPPVTQKGALSCVQIVDSAKVLAMSSINPTNIVTAVKKMLDDDAKLKDEDQKFKDFAKNYLVNLATQIHKFGIEIGTVRAEYTMRKEMACDNKVIDGKEIARLKGIEDATTVLRKLVGLSDFQVMPKGSDCLKLGAAGPTTDNKIKNAITSHLTDGKKKGLFCSDMSLTNPNVVEIYKMYEQGLTRGIKAQLATVWVGTFRNGRPWRISGKIIVVKIDGCHAKDQIKYTTSPLVLDLDRDGLELSTQRVQFDLRATGQMQKTTWTGKREGFLALDLDKDGRITSGRELFGNHTLCGVDRCADGAAALAEHDSNADGLIDSRDKVFSSLKIWVDQNQDGTSQTCEMQSLSKYGIKSFQLKPSYMNKTVKGGKISLKLQVNTKSGSMTAYDVWFNNLTSPGFPTAQF